MASLGNYIEKLCHDITVKLNDDIENIIINTSKDIFGATSIQTEIEMNGKWIISAITEKLEREENNPLTIEKLREMVGEPIWHNGEYDIIQEVFEDEKHIGDWYIDTQRGTIAITAFNNFYKHKPKGDDLHE